MKKLKKITMATAVFTMTVAAAYSVGTTIASIEEMEPVAVIKDMDSENVRDILDVVAKAEYQKQTSPDDLPCGLDKFIPDYDYDNEIPVETTEDPVMLDANIYIPEETEAPVAAEQHETEVPAATLTPAMPSVESPAVSETPAPVPEDNSSVQTEEDADKIPTYNDMNCIELGAWNVYDNGDYGLVADMVTDDGSVNQIWIAADGDITCVIGDPEALAYSENPDDFIHRYHGNAQFCGMNIAFTDAGIQFVCETDGYMMSYPDSDIYVEDQKPEIEEHVETDANTEIEEHVETDANPEIEEHVETDANPEIEEHVETDPIENADAEMNCSMFTLGDWTIYNSGEFGKVAETINNDGWYQEVRIEEDYAITCTAGFKAEFDVVPVEDALSAAIAQFEGEADLDGFKVTVTDSTIQFTYGEESVLIPTPVADEANETDDADTNCIGNWKINDNTSGLVAETISGDYRQIWISDDHKITYCMGDNEDLGMNASDEELAEKILHFEDVAELEDITVSIDTDGILFTDGEKEFFVEFSENA